MKITLAEGQSARFVAGVDPARDEAGNALPVAPGDVVDVPDELGKSLLEQPDVWLPAKTTAKKGDS